MNKKLFVFLLVVSLAVILSGCGAKNVIDRVGELKDAQDLSDALNSSDPENINKAMEKYNEIAQKYEEKDFDEAESVDLPAGFPSFLAYSNGKVTSSSDNTDEYGADVSATFKTKDDFKKVKDYYINLVKGGWKTTNQVSESNYYDMDLEKGSENLNITIQTNEYSVITEISINYMVYNE